MSNAPYSYIRATAARHNAALVITESDDKPDADQEAKAADDVVEETAAGIASASAADLGEVVIKLEILARRLRQHISLKHSGDVIDYLLAESARDDVTRMAATGE